MSKYDNIKARNYADLINIITCANKGGLIVYNLLLKDLYIDSLFSIKIVFKDYSENNYELRYTALIDLLADSAFNNNINHICIFSDCYNIYLKNITEGFLK